MKNNFVFQVETVDFSLGDLAEVSGFVGRITRLFDAGNVVMATLQPVGGRGGVTVPVDRLAHVR